MRKTLFALPLLTMLGAANAADGHFDGYYLGANLGATVWNTFWVDRDAWVDNFGTDWALGTVANKSDDFSGGLQVGYNYRCNSSVFGVELDWTWVDNSNDKTYTPTAGPGTILSLSNELKWYGSVRGKAGIVADHLLLYVTGGAAFARLNHDWLVTAPGEVELGGNSGTRWGYVSGVGGELALSCKWSVKVEGLFFDFPERTTSFHSLAGDQGVHFDNQNSFWTGRIGVNYSF
ncbi:outer membrane protein [Candidatus Berkiella aquae]|uniref:Outer membrane beta-barrel protein n=1 Tax=Candidatus Berkiella aquae TaxID=295108 RepID=A0A0Q9YYA5_9GAMM|nr:outer membrane beta-barrel protein [Candidatus Berkiella aquae]MCS5711885.1 outer membrane beta-barrel protein [Candidatus Berkiella aquae]